MLWVGAKSGMNKCISNPHLASSVCLFSYRSATFLDWQFLHLFSAKASMLFNMDLRKYSKKRGFFFLWKKREIHILKLLSIAVFICLELRLWHVVSVNSATSMATWWIFFQEDHELLFSLRPLTTLDSTAFFSFLLILHWRCHYWEFTGSLSVNGECRIIFYEEEKGDSWSSAYLRIYLMSN